ncbi:hypothetical protein Tco_1093104 [Tanacetum coccineum]|uniref:Uncharacterized protein n=1 Tax=Tanacetum coccineum TaxID=301880 RepID=A0ABQ5ID03_9ASTR
MTLSERSDWLYRGVSMDLVLLQTNFLPCKTKKTLKEAFEVLYNKVIYGSASVELLATFSDNMLNKDGSEKLIDDTIEDTLEKVAKCAIGLRSKQLHQQYTSLKPLGDIVLIKIKAAEEKSIGDCHQLHKLNHKVARLLLLVKVGLLETKKLDIGVKKSTTIQSFATHLDSKALPLTQI